MWSASMAAAARGLRSSCVRAHSGSSVDWQQAGSRHSCKDEQPWLCDRLGVIGALDAASSGRLRCQRPNSGVDWGRLALFIAAWLLVIALQASWKPCICGLAREAAGRGRAGHWMRCALRVPLLLRNHCAEEVRQCLSCDEGSDAPQE